MPAPLPIFKAPPVALNAGLIPAYTSIVKLLPVIFSAPAVVESDAKLLAKLRVVGT